MLLSKKYEVHGIIRKASSFNTGRLDHLITDIHEKKHEMYLHYGDLVDTQNIMDIISKVMPDEIYNLGAQSHVHTSFELTEYTTNVTVIGLLRLVNGIRNIDKEIKIYQAST